jgi:hypothetical protein
MRQSGFAAGGAGEQHVALARVPCERRSALELLTRFVVATKLCEKIAAHRR